LATEGSRETVTKRWFSTHFVLVVIGGAAMIVGSFLNWAGPVQGTHTYIRALWDPEFTRGELVRSVGFVMILLGSFVILGAVFEAGWISLLASILGVAVVILFGVEVLRGSSSMGDVHIGLWLSLAGAVLATLGGFSGRSTFGSGP
jgi:hypothetical protein